MANRSRALHLVVVAALLGGAAYAVFLFHQDRGAAPYVATGPSTVVTAPDAGETPSPGTRPVLPPATLAAADLGAWNDAIARVEERRGSAGAIVVPDELKHYEDRRRFLAVQMADSRREDYDLPHDQADLALMIQRGEMAEMSPLGPDHILYEIGTDAREDPLAHYDAASGKDVPLFPSMEAYEAEDARLEALAAGKGRAAAQARDRREFLASFYRQPDTRDQLFREHEAITALADNFGGSHYDLGVPADRARFQARLLSFVRPAARAVIVELAQAYHAQFGRLLPITSTVRTQRYQRRLSGVNSNATRVDLPPHTTGMAFDISYKFMAPDEQNFVMEQVARLEDAGRVEALRERRNHLHVYVLADGRPDDTLIASFLDDVEAAHVGPAPRTVKKVGARRTAVQRTSVRARRGHTAAKAKARPAAAKGRSRPAARKRTRAPRGD
jgi:hypothetical protein